MGQRTTCPGDQVDLGVVDPNGVGAAESRSEQAHAIQMGGEGHAVMVQAGGALHGGLGEVGLQGQAVFVGEVGAAAQKFVRAVERDGGRDAEADLVAGVRPAAGCLTDRCQGGFRRGGSHCLGDRSQLRREGVQKPRDRLVEGAIGDHRGNYRAHADIGVGPRDVREGLGTWDRQHRRQVVAGGAAFAQHLHRRQQGGQIAIAGGAGAVDPRPGVQQQFQRHAVADTFRQAAVAVGMGVHQAWYDEAAGGVDPLRRLRAAGRDDGGDAVALQHDIGRAGGGIARGEHESAEDNGMIGIHGSPLI